MAKVLPDNADISGTVEYPNEFFVNVVQEYEQFADKLNSQLRHK